jgi:ABC-type bacteriocin/lantibiotic exporter with double-glycine peptidase domain
MFSQEELMQVHKIVRTNMGIEDPALGIDIEFQSNSLITDFDSLVNTLNLIGEGDRIIYQHHTDLHAESLESDIDTPYLLLTHGDKKLYLVHDVNRQGLKVKKCLNNADELSEIWLDPKSALADGFSILSFHRISLRVGVNTDGYSEEGNNLQPIHPVRRLWNLLSSQKEDITLIYFYGLIAGLLSLVLPLTIQSITGLVSGGLVLQPVVLLIGVAIIATIITGVIQIMQQTIIEAIQRRIFANTSMELSFKLPRLDRTALKDIYTPELVNRFFDVLTLQKSISKLLIDFVTVKLTLVFGLLLLAFYHPYFIVFSIVLVILLFFLFYLTGAKGLQTSLMESKYKYKLVFWLEEMARAMNTFKLAGNPELGIKHTREYLGGYLNKRKNHFRILITQYSAAVILKTLVTASTLILGTVLVINREITLGQFVASEIIIITVLGSIEKFISSFETIYDMLTALDKIAQLTEKPLERSSGIVLKEEKVNEYEFKNLSLSYDKKGKKVLTDISLTIKPGQIVGLMGQNGSGRSSLLNILSGLETQYDGIFRINDIPLKEIHLPTYRKNIGDNISIDGIFNGSILENISVGRSGISLENVRWAIKKVGLNDFVDSLENGIHTLIQSAGAGLSTSTSRQIILARSICGNPDLLIFDDFYGYLPNPQKRIFLDTLCDTENHWTVVAATHDPRFLARCDVIHIMENGKIVESGSIEVLAKSERFQELIATKLLREDDNNA